MGLLVDEMESLVIIRCQSSTIDESIYTSFVLRPRHPFEY